MWRAPASLQMLASWRSGTRAALRRSLIPQPESLNTPRSLIKMTRWYSMPCYDVMSLQIAEICNFNFFCLLLLLLVCFFPTHIYKRCPDEEFAAALEKQMKAEEGGLSRFGALAGALTKLSYNYHMVMPGYIILFIRTFLTLEGIAGVVTLDLQENKVHQIHLQMDALRYINAWYCFNMFQHCICLQRYCLNLRYS